MHQFLEKVEKYNAKLIIPAVVLLLGVVLAELFFHELAETYHTLISVLDGIVVAVFAVDLVFLAIRARTTKYFFKHYWLDIVAIFPFAIATKLLSRLYLAAAVGGQVGIGQAVLHETLEARKAARVVARIARAGRFIRIAARLTRAFSKTRFFGLLDLFVKTDHAARKNLRKGISTRHAEKSKVNKARKSSSLRGKKREG